MKSVDKSTIHQKPPKVLGNYSIKKDGRTRIKMKWSTMAHFIVWEWSIQRQGYWTNTFGNERQFGTWHMLDNDQGKEWKTDSKAIFFPIHSCKVIFKFYLEVIKIIQCVHFDICKNERWSFAKQCQHSRFNQIWQFKKEGSLSNYFLMRKALTSLS